MSKENSPEYQRGLDDGRDDALALSGCPPGIALGRNPRTWKYPWMYLKGYGEAFQPSPCAHTGNCKVARERQKLAQILQNRPVVPYNSGS